MVIQSAVKAILKLASQPFMYRAIVCGNFCVGWTHCQLIVNVTVDKYDIH